MAKKYLYTDENIILPKINWEEQVLSNSKKRPNDLKIFRKYFYDLPFVNNNVKGIKNKFTIISPETHLGDKGGILWTIYIGFKLYQYAKYIIIIEDDLLFNKDWLKIADQIYNETVNNQNLGLISMYNRTSNDVINNSLYFKIDNIGGVMYLIPRFVFDLLLNERIFDQRIEFNNNSSGDVYFYQFVLNHGLNIFNSSASYIQHIGIKSICRNGQFLRYSKNFLRPYAWNEDFDK